MSCYLCAYRSTKAAKEPEPLPPGSPAKPNDNLATCSSCAVWACSSHGIRYAKFECLMCMPKSAITEVVVAQTPPTGTGGAAAALAHLVGERTTENQKGRMGSALAQIRRDSEASRMTVQEQRIVPAGTGEPNLIANLAAVIREHSRSVEGVVPKVRTQAGSYGVVSIDAVSAAVRNTFAATEFVEPSDEVVKVLMGALLLSLSVAHEPVARRRATEPADWPAKVEVPPPWEISHPGLLDPVLWMIGTAYSLA